MHIAKFMKAIIQCVQQAKEDAAGGDENLLDFSVLFEMESLQKALLNIK